MAVYFASGCHRGKSSRVRARAHDREAPLGQFTSRRRRRPPSLLCIINRPVVDTVTVDDANRINH